jgi:hypothetical protein
MNRVVFVIAFIFIYACSWAQDNSATDIESFKNNKIKMQVVYEYEYVKGNPSSTGKKIQEIFFDVDGNRIQEINFRYNGTIHCINTYKYDLKGNKIEYIKYEGNKEKMIFRQFFQYNDKGNVITESGFNGVENYKTTFKYDPNGKITEVVYFLDNKLDEKRTFSYSNKTSELSVMDATLQVSYKINYTYNDKMQVVKEEKVDNIGFVSKRVLYTYDAKGNQTVEEKYLNGKFASKITNTYDSKNRIVQVYSELMPGQRFLTREYTYSQNGLLEEEKYRNTAAKDFSKNSYKYMENGVCKSMDSFYASYNEQVMYVYNYEKY